MDKHLREFYKGLAQEGLKILNLSRTGKSHYKALIEGPDGKTMTYHLANSPSDRRAAKNGRSNIKRFFNK